MHIAYILDNLKYVINPKTSVPDDKFSSEIINLKSGNIRIMVKGKGKQSVLLCPDPPNGIEHYEELINILSKKYRVIAFEAPGFGYSTPSLNFDYTVFSGSDLIKEIMDHTFTNSAILCLPCVSGLHALQFSFDNPDRVDGFVAIQTPSWDELLKWVQRTDSSKIIKMPFIGQSVMALGSNYIQDIWYSVAEPDLKKRNEYIKIKDQRHKNGCIFCLASALQAIKGKDPFHNKKLKKPSVIIWGGSDKTYKKVEHNTISKYLDNPELISLTKAGHFPEMTYPEKLLEAIDRISG